MVIDINKISQTRSNNDTPKKHKVGFSLDNPGPWNPSDPLSTKKYLENTRNQRIFENHWLPILSEAINKKDYRTLELLIIEWGTKYGFKAEYLSNWAEQDLMNFGFMVYEVYLSFVPGCSGKFRSSKFKSKIPKHFKFGRSLELFNLIKSGIKLEVTNVN